MRYAAISMIVVGIWVMAFISLAAEDEWSQKADIPTPRWGMATCVVDGKIYAMGGSPDNNRALSTVEVCDPATDTWEEGTDMPTPRYCFFGDGVVKNRMYLVGGSQDGAFTPSAVVEEYTPEGWPFAVHPQGKMATTWGEIKHGR